MVWSSAARNIVSIRLITMVRTSSGLSGAGGASGGASLSSITSLGRWDSSSAISSGNVDWSAGKRLCRSYLFIWGVMLLRGRVPRGNHSLRRNLCSNSLLRQAPQRMGASHGDVLAMT
jgi:hypothetical protein